MTVQRSELPPHIAARMPGTVPVERIATAHVHRHGPGLAAQLLAVPDTTSAVADALDQLGVGTSVPGHRLPRVSGSGAVCGPAGNPALRRVRWRRQRASSS